MKKIGERFKSPSDTEYPQVTGPRGRRWAPGDAKLMFPAPGSWFHGPSRYRRRRPRRFPLNPPVILGHADRDEAIGVPLALAVQVACRPLSNPGQGARRHEFSSGQVRFDDAEFSGGRVNFYGAQFFGRDSLVRFRHAKFSGGEVNFTAEFSGGTVHFGDAEFSGGDVSFDNALFSGGAVSFGGAKFSGGKVDFSRAADWSHPPKFDWEDTPPQGVKASSSAPRGVVNRSLRAWRMHGTPTPSVTKPLPASTHGSSPGEAGGDARQASICRPAPRIAAAPSALMPWRCRCTSPASSASSAAPPAARRGSGRVPPGGEPACACACRQS